MTTRSYSDSNDVMNPGTSVAAGTANAGGVDLLATDYRPKRRPCIIRTTVCLQAATTFSAIINDGALDRTHTFNSGVALVANAVYTFDLVIDEASAEKTVNFQTGGAATISTFTVEEVNEAA